MPLLKVCSKCKRSLPLDCFSKDLSRKDKLHGWCKKCMSRYFVKRYHTNSEFRMKQLEHVKKYESTQKRKDWQKRHRAKRIKLYQNYQRQLKEKIHKLLGSQCVGCGYVGTALQIDHVNNDGFQDRKKARKERGCYYAYVLKKLEAGSKEYQLLCANCNWEKRFLKP